MLKLIRGRRGIALPLALLGLMIVSFLVVAAIVTSGAELTGSSTQQRATAALYDADAALERYIAMKAEAGAVPTDSLSPQDADPAIPGFYMHVGRLYSHAETNGITMSQEQLYSVTALPEQGRGRSVGSFVRTERSAEGLFVNVSAGLTVGGDVNITGNSTISDGSGNAACDSASAQHAIQVSAGSEVNLTGGAEMVGTADTASYTTAQMVEQLLGGLTVQQAVALASVKIKGSEFNRIPQSHDAGVVRPRSDDFNWGCPFDHDCASVAGNEGNIDYFPMVAIDAEGQKVTLNTDHGQGVLIVHNGSAQFEGNMAYSGIIIVEGDLVIRGSVRIQGSVLGLGATSTVDDNLTGTSTVTYNQCATVRAQESANEQRLLNAPQRFPERTTNWFEYLQ